MRMELPLISDFLFYIQTVIRSVILKEYDLYLPL